MKKLSLLLAFVFFVGVSYTPPPDDYTSILINGEACGPHGNARESGREYQSNVFKNRFDFPRANDFDASIDLDKMAAATEDEQGFSPEKAVEIEGYVVAVKPGGVETCNCKTKDPLLRDTHIELITDPADDGKEKRVIVEVTPRIRQILEEQGVDWSTENLKQTLKNQFIRVQGWLFYDVSHDKENFADDPDNTIGRDNWRASSWEVHPVTSIEVLTDELPVSSFASTGYRDEGEEGSYTPGSGAPLVKAIYTSNAKQKDMNTTQSPTDMLILIVLGAILGMVGQGIRVIVGLKKMQDAAASAGKTNDEVYQGNRVMMSLLIACAIGAIAGIIAALSKVGATIDKSVLVAFITAGYAGTDFIEGFLRKEGAGITRTPPPTPGEGPAVPVKPVAPAPPEKGNSPV